MYFAPIGCNPVLDGTASAENGLETDGPNEEYTLMSIDTIINGKVIIGLRLMTIFQQLLDEYKHSWYPEDESYLPLL